MNKEELFQELSAKVSAGEVSREEIVSRFSRKDNMSDGKRALSGEKTHFSAMKMLYILGAVIVIIGILIFVGQIWDDMGSFSRIAITLGLGILFTAGGSILLSQRAQNEQKDEENSLGAVFYTMGGILIPGGAMVAISELSVGVVSLWPVTTVFGVIFIFYLLLNYVHRNTILTFFSIVNGTIFTYLLVESIVDGPSYMHDDLYAYLTMVVGASYLLLAYAFRSGWNARLVSVLYFFGSAGVLGAAFSRVFDSGIWEMLYFFITIGGIFLATYMKSRSVLMVSTLFLVAHVAYITGEYFADSLGWPITLIFLGFIFIGLGYASVNINKKYIADA